MTFYVYVLRCADGTFYAGYTDDVGKRIAAHNSGKGAKYTAARIPVELVAKWAFAGKSEALKAEHAFKQLSRKEKLERISGPGRI